uniref:Uncharacterized protein n=1 Tax=Arundo donax TaxID=35708 RepID=A0A0A9C6E6_ARUDO
MDYIDAPVISLHAVCALLLQGMNKA